ncbi:MAG: helix-turn-helix domain-containing protein [Verrucomicrobiota bacterium]
MKQHTSEELITISDVSKRLRLSTRTVYRLIASGEFPPPVKIGSATRFYKNDLNTYLNRLRDERQV